MALNNNGPVSPWWRYPMVWLVVGGPALVILASFVTLGLALRHPDPALQATPPSATHAPADDAGGATQPAVMARNHAATGRH